MNTEIYTTFAQEAQACDPFAAADEHLAAAIGSITEGLSNGGAGASETCSLLIELLESAREPLRRLAGLQ